MTIIDVALHKWRMLDDRRRKIIIGSIIILVAIIVAIVFVVRSHSNGGEQSVEVNGVGEDNTGSNMNQVPTRPGNQSLSNTRENNIKDDNHHQQ
jgi:hypothetical protein